ncbi:hypothetical protein MMC34_004603 [Xylographa carneopallida]|nr:hypothetical protein [Xylographa carneopallida]
MCILTGTTFPYCSHGIRILWCCPSCTGHTAAPGELPSCPQFQDRRIQIDFPCAICTGADISIQNTLQAQSMTLAPYQPTKTQEETLERARLARVASEERMRREGTTLEIENQRSRASKAEWRGGGGIGSSWKC